MATLTNESGERITEQQISALRREAGEHGDYEMAAICALALDGAIDTGDWTTLSDQQISALRQMTQDEAYDEIVDVINAARAHRDYDDSRPDDNDD